MADIETDVAIIGAGTAGLAAERHARAKGARTKLIDEAFAGTTCATVGCMPSKLLIAAGEVAHSARQAEPFGIRLPDPEIDGAAVLNRLRTERDKFVSATKKAFDALPEGVCIEARARFTGPLELLLDEARTLRAKAIVIATGAEPHIPGAFQQFKDLLLTNENLFELESLPGSVGIIGAGPLGLEMAQALARLGVDIEVFDRGNTLAGLPGGRIEASLREALSLEFPIHFGVKTKAERGPEGISLQWWGDNNGSREFDRLLVSAGRAPKLQPLNLEATGLDLDEHGTPCFDPESLQCGSAPIFIAGDANHDMPVLHEASAEGTIAGCNAANWPRVEGMNRKTTMQIMFTDPAMAILGDPDEGGGKITGTADYSDQGRAKVHNTNRGICEIHADGRDGRLVGARMVAPRAEHLAHLIGWFIQKGVTASELLDMPFYHPTFEEGLKPALQEICKKAGSAKSRERDDGFLPGDS
ncbi:dihydrolipoyl dehydrogenase [Henriciella sp.]|uniref:dihydrolipoyl dehydrogenase n=1 Tax=Henriciella sp. TaxID=1968823 RepID=UPI0026306064|nr:dihydrolipoyl dehydrogenase [Henriciella sp.]